MSNIKKEINIYVNERPETSAICDIEFEYTTDQDYIDRCRIFIKVPLGWALLEEFEGKDTLEKVKRYWGTDLNGLTQANEFLKEILK